MNVVITKSQLKIIQEQIRPVPTGQKKTNQFEIFSFQNLRDFLYSTEGIALIYAMDSVGGEPIPVILFTILVLKDIIDWIEFGEPNWVYLISDLICVFTAGFASPIAKSLVKESGLGIKTIFSKFPQLKQFFQKNITIILQKIFNVMKYLKKFLEINFPSIKFIVDLFSKITKNSSGIYKKLEIVKKTILIYAKYEIFSQGFNKFMETENGQDFASFVIPKLNPLLGPDKLPQFLVDLVSKPTINVYNSLVSNT